MFSRLTARVLLVCYGVIALAGQGLHEFLDDDGCGASQASVVTAEVSVQSVGAWGDAEQSLTVHLPTVQSPGGSHTHDCDHCPICQFQALGQHFVAPAPVASGLTLCDMLLLGRIESVYCPALFSSAQPRAPPIA